MNSHKNILVGILLTLTVVVSGCASDSEKKVTSISEVTMQYSLVANGVPMIPQDDPVTLAFQLGSSALPLKVQSNIVGMTVGSTKEIFVTPHHGFGEYDKTKIIRVAKTAMPEGLELVEGMTIEGVHPDTGKTVASQVIKILDNTIILDQNHPLAGKDLVFQVKMLAIK